MISEKDYAEMVGELLGEPSRCDKLCEIALSFLPPIINKNCALNPALRYACENEDILHNICIVLMQKTVTKFLLNDGVDSWKNKDVNQFAAWMVTVAKNYICTCAKKAGRRDSSTVSTEDEWVIELPDSSVDEAAEERIETLKRALDIVLSADASVYKTLTWLAVYVLILDLGKNKIEVNRILVEKFKPMSLNEMFDYLLCRARTIEWLSFSDEQLGRIREALGKPTEDGRRMGEVPYGEFYMNYKGAPSGLKSVSDWTNRLNGIVLRRFGAEDGNSKNHKKNPKPKNSKKAQTNGKEENKDNESLDD